MSDDSLFAALRFNSEAECQKFQRALERVTQEMSEDECRAAAAQLMIALQGARNVADDNLNHYARERGRWVLVSNALVIFHGALILALVFSGGPLRLFLLAVAAASALSLLASVAYLHLRLWLYMKERRNRPPETEEEKMAAARRALEFELGES